MVNFCGTLENCEKRESLAQQIFPINFTVIAIANDIVTVHISLETIFVIDLQTMHII